MLNGPFGAGKTTVATALAARLPDAMLYDPEVVGLHARDLTAGILPAYEATDDFQDIRLWPDLVVATAGLIHARYGRSLIVPMTLDDPDRLARIREGFREIDPRTHHVCLMAPLDVLLERLRAREVPAGADPAQSWRWAERRATESRAALAAAQFGPHVASHGRPVEETIAEILRLVA
ncbi:AAA family ATPase [Pelagovum pacificum]|nr:AAA family ATPase [Pelagovum pacificum]